jgi:hypothetical protein
MIDQLTTTAYPTIPVYFAGGKHPYALGPLPLDQLTSLAGELENGYPFTVQVPTLFAKMQHDPEFLAGCQFGYECYDDKPGTTISLCNFIAQVLREELSQPGVDFDTYLWVIGYVLGWLAGVAETEPVLAQVGILHQWFLLSYIPPSRLQEPRSRMQSVREVAFHHMVALKAYRARVRELIGQGVELRAAYNRALILYTTPVEDIPFPAKKHPMGVIVPFRPRVQK